MALGDAEVLVQLLPDGSNGPSPTTVRAAWISIPGMKPSAGPALFVHALIQQTNPDDLVLVDKRAGHGRARPDLDGARALDLRAHPLHELAHGKHQSVVLVEERWRPRQFDGFVCQRSEALEGANAGIRRAQGPGSAAGPDRVQEVNHGFFGDRRGQRDLPRVEIGKGLAQTPRASHHSGDTKTDVVRPFVAEDLRRHAGHHRALDGRRAVRIDHALGQAGQKAGHRRTEADADDVGVQALSFGGRGEIGRVGGIQASRSLRQWVRRIDSFTPGNRALPESSLE